MCGGGGMHGEGGACVVKGGMRGERGACVVKGGMHSDGGCAWQRGTCMAKGGACMAKGEGMHGMHVPPLRDTASQCPGGMHLTGMHSCLFKFLVIANMFIQK